MKKFFEKYLEGKEDHLLNFWLKGWFYNLNEKPIYEHKMIFLDNPKDYSGEIYKTNQVIDVNSHSYAEIMVFYTGEREASFMSNCGWHFPQWGDTLENDLATYLHEVLIKDFIETHNLHETLKPETVRYLNSYSFNKDKNIELIDIDHIIEYLSNDLLEDEIALWPCNFFYDKICPFINYDPYEGFPV